MSSLKLSDPVIHKELDLIQAIVTRMAENSFKVKAWLIGLLTVIVAFEKDAIFASGENIPVFIKLGLNLVLILPIVCFWYLDGFFLKTEKLYRELYKWVVKYRPQTDLYLYDLNTFKREVNGETENLIKTENTTGKMMRSKTLLPFYLMPLIFVLGLFTYNLGLLFIFR